MQLLSLQAIDLKIRFISNKQNKHATFKTDDTKMEKELSEDNGARLMGASFSNGQFS